MEPSPTHTTIRITFSLKRSVLQDPLKTLRGTFLTSITGLFIGKHANGQQHVTTLDLQPALQQELHGEQ